MTNSTNLEGTLRMANQIQTPQSKMKVSGLPNLNLERSQIKFQGGPVKNPSRNQQQRNQTLNAIGNGKNISFNKWNIFFLIIFNLWVIQI